MKRLSSALIGFFMMVMGGVPLAYAGCMDDAGDAVAAFFTGGASYATCQVVDTVRSLLRTVQTIAASMTRMINDTIDAARRGVDDTANSIESNTRNAMRNLQSKVNEASRMASQASDAASPQAQLAETAGANQQAAGIQQQALSNNVRIARPAGSPSGLNQRSVQQLRPGTRMQAQGMQQAQAPRPMSRMGGVQQMNPSSGASSRDIANTMRQAANTMQSIHNDLASHAVNQIIGAARQAKNLAERHVGAAQRIGQTTVVAPMQQLQDMLGDLLRHPGRIFDPSAMVNETIERMTVAMTQVTEQIHHEIMNEALATIGDIDGHIRRMTGDVSRADNIHQAMIKLQRRKDEQSLNELRTLLRGSSDSMMRLASMLKIMPDMVMMQQSSEQKSESKFKPMIDALKRENNKLRNDILKAQRGQMPANTEQRAKNELNRMLAGKSPDEQQAIKNQLKNDLKNRYAGNEKALAQINRHFEQRFSSAFKIRVMPTPLKISPIAPPLPK